MKEPFVKTTRTFAITADYPNVFTPRKSPFEDRQQYGISWLDGTTRNNAGSLFAPLVHADPAYHPSLDRAYEQLVKAKAIAEARNFPLNRALIGMEIKITTETYEVASSNFKGIREGLSAVIIDIDELYLRVMS